MSNISRLLFNLGVSYTLMNREEFTEKFTSLFEKYGWDEEKLAGISHVILDELENFRTRRNVANVVNDAQAGNNKELLDELQKLTAEIQNLNAQLRRPNPDQK